jgi:chromosome segregation ATPase
MTKPNESVWLKMIDKVDDAPTPQGEIAGLVERLRECAKYYEHSWGHARLALLCREAASALEQLSAERDRLKKAFPFHEWRKQKEEAQARIASYEKVAAASAKLHQDHLNRIAELEECVAELLGFAGTDKARIAELEEDLDGREAVCDSYADENQRFHDRIERLEGALREIANPPSEIHRIGSASIARAALKEGGR